MKKMMMTTYYEDGATTEDDYETVGRVGEVFSPSCDVVGMEDSSDEEIDLNEPPPPESPLPVEVTPSILLIRRNDRTEDGEDERKESRTCREYWIDYEGRKMRKRKHLDENEEIEMLEGKAGSSLVRNVHPPLPLPSPPTNNPPQKNMSLCRGDRIQRRRRLLDEMNAKVRYSPSPSSSLGSSDATSFADRTNESRRQEGSVPRYRYRRSQGPRSIRFRGNGKRHEKRSQEKPETDVASISTLSIQPNQQEDHGEFPSNLA